MTKETNFDHGTSSDDEDAYLFDNGPGDNKLMDIDSMLADKAADVEPSDYSQSLLLSYLVSAPELWIKCAPIIQASYFDQEYQPVIKLVQEHLKKYKDMPSPDMIHSDTGVLLNKQEDAHKDSRQEWVCDQIEEFCRTTAFQDFLVNAAETVSTDRSRKTLANLMNQAASVERISLIRNLGVEVHTGSLAVLNDSKDNDSISTGYRHMDRAFGGGLTRPSFNIVSCASGDGKSIYMQNQLVNYIEMGMNCIFYTLELAPPTVIKRFAAMMTNTDIAEVYTHIDSVGHALYQRGKQEGSLWVIKFPMIGTTMADIAAHRLELSMHTGLEFQAMAIDYIDIMDPVETVDRSNIHMKDKFVSEEMNNWAHENELILWSASQQTKGAQDEKDPRQSGVSGGTPKINTCDNLIIGKRNEDDTEEERWWAHVAKARSSGAIKTKIPLYWNRKTMRMSDGNAKLFEESNPKLFNKKRSEVENNDATTNSNDPIAKELGVNVTVAKPPTGTEKKIINTFARLRSLNHEQQELDND